MRRGLIINFVDQKWSKFRILKAKVQLGNQPMKLNQIVSALELWAPLKLQEGYDNAGLIVGDLNQDLRSALVTLDCTEAVVDEAIASGAQLIIAHHPIVFAGMKRFTGKTYIERVVMKAIKHDISIYAIHTNLDHINTGVNRHLCDLLGIHNPRILQPKTAILEKLVVFVPKTHAEQVRKAIFDAGAGAIGNYDECSFNTEGEGTFRAGTDANPTLGSHLQRHTEPETRVEVLLRSDQIPQVIRAMRAAHPYEEVAYDRILLQNETSHIGAGMIGNLPQPVPWMDFFDEVKKVLSASVIKHTACPETLVQNIAVCGGAGVFLLQQARSAGADVLITSDVKYHEFFDAEGIVLADVGHWESEHRTKELIVRYLNEKFPKFAVHLSRINTNPVKYH
jgi:dinuclear metal center YbgI/SA1388 family protein